MKLVKCANGHFYDQDKFATCPSCQGGNGDGPTVGMGNEEFQRNLFQQDVPTMAPRRYDSVLNRNADSPTVPDYLDDITKKPQAKDDDATKGEWQLEGSSFKLEPTVGWLVCLNGEEKGKSFPLKSGRNFIGRGEDSDVRLAKDQTVSRERHAVVIYDPKGRKFYVQPGESKGLFYQNNEVVLSNNELSARDTLSVGNTNLIFVPLCGSDFDWGKQE